MMKKFKFPWQRKTGSATRTVVNGREVEDGNETKPSPLGPNGLLNLKNLPQPQWTRFEDANPWEPEEHVIMYCMNGQDNVPTRTKLDNGFVYYVSQSRSPGHKDQGQDCLATATQDNWEVHVLCDGHDKAGHMVSLGVCQQLPRILLRKITERNKENPAGADDEIEDKIMSEAFDETSKVVCWTKDGISVGLWVKVFDGQWADKPGFIKESHGQGKVKVAIIDENGYHLPSLDRSSLRRPRYTGGCTCICLIRNKVTKECKVAVTGDSRMLILPTMGVNDAILFKQPGLDEPDSPDSAPEGLITPAHNVFNEDEKERLEKDYAGQYEFDGNFLVNPITKFAIQPTRGFGDFDMFGTGYTHVPEISKTFKLEPNGMIFTASDGVFDTHVWADEELVSCLDRFLKDGLSNVQIIERMYRETLERSQDGGYVDDISIYCFIEPSEDSAVAKAKVGDDVKIEIKKKEKEKKNTRKDRRTIGRGPNGYTDLSEKVQELKAKMDAEKKVKEIEKADDLVEVDESIAEGNKSVMENLAKSHKVTVNTDEILPKSKKSVESEDGI